ncbi:hypothetical protein QQ045_002651 [Rhodiola kirilowii]
MVALNIECGFFALSIPRDPRFANVTSIFDVCRLLVEHGKSTLFPMIYGLICLISTLPVSTATTERTVSLLNIIKSTLINKMNNEFLDDLIVLYVERTYADYISNDAVIVEFEMSGVRRFLPIRCSSKDCSRMHLKMLGRNMGIMEHDSRKLKGHLVRGVSGTKQ